MSALWLAVLALRPPLAPTAYTSEARRALIGAAVSAALPGRAAARSDRDYGAVPAGPFVFGTPLLGPPRATVRRELFGENDPVGSNVRVGNVSCAVIGTLGEKGESSMGRDQDDIVLMPISAFQRRVGGDSYIESILLAARDGVSTEELEADVTALLRQRRNIQPGRANDFEVNDMTEIANAVTGTKSHLTGMLTAVAAVSLLVGGIGIMNIMLVSVTERTREIGLRLTVGALERQVLLQFMVEAVVLSLLGGVLGVLIGLGVAYAVVQYLAVPFVIAPWMILGAFVFSALIGIIFGFFPARRAARMNPIEALRHE